MASSKRSPGKTTEKMKNEKRKGEKVKDKKIKEKAKEMEKAQSGLRKYLTTSSNSSSSNNPHSTVQKGDQSLFVTYLKNTQASTKDPLAANQAARLLEQYREMTNEAKKAMVTGFFKSGGRKAGLSSLFKQSISSQASANEKGWAGWATPSTIMSFSTVNGVDSAPKQHHLLLVWKRGTFEKPSVFFEGGVKKGQLNMFSDLKNTPRD